MKTRFIVCAIICDGDKILLGKKAKGVPPYPDVWHTPGGGTNDKRISYQLVKKKDYDNIYFHNELKREIKEETGLEIDNIHCICPKFRSSPRESKARNKNSEMTHYIFLEYFCKVAGGRLCPSDDLAEAKWVSRPELKKVSLTPPSQEMYRELRWIR